MSKSKGRLLAELLSSDGKVKSTKSALTITDGKITITDIPVIPNSKLKQSAVTIAGESLSLGGTLLLNTGHITEHTNYKYYTDTRVRAAISATGSLSYNSATGVMSFTMPTQNTSNITEGTNLYFTDTRVDARIVNAGSANWNTAYGWGDHASQSYATQSYVGTAISNLVDSSPAALNTLNELAAALGDDPNFATTVSTSIGTKLPLAGGALTGAVTTNSTFDGRNVSVDGSKLDTIATSANNYTLPFTNNSTNWNTAHGWGNHASAGYITNSGGTTASTVNTVVKRDASGDINARLLRSEFDTTNASIGYIMTQVDTASNNYVRPSTPAQLRSALNVADGANNYSLPATVLHSNAYKMTASGFKLGFVSGAGGTTFGANHYSMGVDIANGAWSNPHYSDLIIGYHTGIRIGAAYTGTRFYNNSPTTDTNNTGNGNGVEVLLMTVGGHAAGTGVKVHQNLSVGTTSSFAGVADFNGGHGGINITNTSILSSASSTWTGDPGGAGKIQYHSNRWYIVADSSSNRIVQFRRNNSDKSYIDNNGAFVGNVTGNVTGSSGSCTGNAATVTQNHSDGGGNYPVLWGSSGTTYYTDEVYITASTNRLRASILSASNFYVGAGENDGRFYSDTPGRTAFASGDFYIQTSVTNCYLYPTNLYLGNSSGTNSYFRSNNITGTNWGITAAGAATFATIGGTHLGGTHTGSFIGTTTTRNQSMIGLYSSQKTDQIWSMGSAYRNHASGSNFGNLYGLAYKHPNNGTGGELAGGHMMVWCQNGTPYSAMGTNIWTSGAVKGASFLYNSDKALKENIKPIENALNTILSLSGVSYTVKKTKKNTTGFIAQEVEKVLPDMVEGEEGEKGVNYGQMVALLTEAMREQQDMIVALQEEVKELKNAIK